MKPSEILFLASKSNIRLWVDNGALRYRAPKGSLTQEIRKVLTEHKAGIIAYLKGESSTTSDIYPLSYNQQFLWFLYHFAPQSPSYNVAFVSRVVSQVDFKRMDATFQKLTDRHPMLRSSYESKNGVPCMRIHGSSNLTCEHIDATNWREETLNREVHRRYNEPFDIERGPILRVQLFTSGFEDHVLLLTIHHIACDGWSVGILLKEFGDLYSYGEVVRLPTGLPYIDFTRYQAEMLKGPEGGRLTRFWGKQLGGALLELKLPVDKQRPRMRGPSGSTHHFSITGDLYQNLISFARSSGATFYTLLLTAFQILLMRYSSQEDILIGTPMASRPRKEDEVTVGCYVNPVLLRGTISAHSTFKELLRRTRKTFTDAFEHRHYPFPLLVEQLSPVRVSGRSPIFQVMFNFLTRQMLGKAANLLYRDKSAALAGESVVLGELKLRPFYMDQEEGQFDLALEVIDNGRSLTGLLKYATDLFEEATIVRMARHFEILLQGIVSDPDRSVSELPLLTPEERHQVIVEWNKSKKEYPKGMVLHEMFENQAEKTPDRVAVECGGKRVTYKEFNGRANQLGHYLRKLGVGPERFVGVFMGRSLELVLSLYGILKVGGAYVPFDPEYPPDRLAYMVKDTKVPVVLTQEHLKSKFPKTDAKVICLDSEWGKIDKESTENPKSDVKAENVAYVIYTSGSTGKPKGVMNEHRGIVNRLLWMQDEYGLTEADRVLQKTPYSFDVSVWEFFWPLLVGSRLVVAPPGIHRDPAALIELIVEKQITTMHFVPSMLQVFLREKGVKKCTCLKRVICSGEALPYELQERFFERLDCELHNLYGPTEAAVDVTYWKCMRNSDYLTVPIGRPVANTQMYILDPFLQAVPIGVAGELHIGGVQVARGYLNRPELTAEKFIPDPFSSEPGARLYKTGDLARYLPDGAIAYLGRNDFQVKIRGLRIELGEIEAVMAQHPEVVEAVVTAKDGISGEKAIVAYFVPKGSKQVSVSDLRTFLRGKMPDYMVPSIFVQLEEFPLLENGKVNRKALPEPAGDRPEIGSPYISPRTETEKTIARIWQGVLGIEKIGINDNFFELGGSSLLLVRTLQYLNESFDRNLKVAQLIEYSTVASLARYLGEDANGKSRVDDAVGRSEKKRAKLARLRKRR